MKAESRSPPPARRRKAGRGALAGALLCLIFLGAARAQDLEGAAGSLYGSSLARVESRLGARLGEPAARLVVAAGRRDFEKRVEELAGAAPPEWALAIALPQRRAVVLRGDRLLAGNDFLEPTLRHEIAHLVLGAVAARSGRPIPRWLDEGLAQYAEEAPLPREQELELAAQARFGTLESFSKLEKDFPPHAVAAQRAYAQSLSFVLFLDKKGGGVRELVSRLDRGSSAEEAIRAVAGEPQGEAEAEWALDLASRSSVIESLLRSSGFWWGAVSVLALLAIARYVLATRRLRKKLSSEDADPGT